MLAQESSAEAGLEIEVSEKQQLALSVFDNPAITDAGYGGGAGGAKSFTVCMWAVKECRKYPGIRIGLGRNEISNLRKTTVRTLLDKVHPKMGVKKGDFRYSPLVDPGVYYRNGSSIVFVDLAWAPSDPDFDRLGSLELTHNIIEEAGEVMKKARDVFTSRKNRHLNAEYGIVGKTITTCNPSRNFMRPDYYDPYMQLGGGDMRRWPMRNDVGEPIYAILPGGRRIPAYRAFIKSLVSDNPFADANYVQNLNNLPEAERKRLKDGDWDFFHDERTLFKRAFFRRTALYKDDSLNYAGCDPSRGGDDCTFAEIKGGTLVSLEKLPIPKEIKDKGTYVAEHFIRFCDARKIPAKRAALDYIGIGESVSDSCIRLGFPVQKFNAGSKVGVRTIDEVGYSTRSRQDPNEKNQGMTMFDNIRSQNFYDLAQASNAGTFSYAEDLPFYAELCTQLEAHGYTTKERMIIVDKKSEGTNNVKAKLGQSPDLADAVQAAWWVSKREHYSLSDRVSL